MSERAIALLNGEAWPETTTEWELRIYGDAVRAQNFRVAADASIRLYRLFKQAAEIVSMNAG